MIKQIIEKAIIRGEKLSDEERIRLLDYFERAEATGATSNPTTGAITGPTQSEISAMVEQSLKSSIGQYFPRLSDITHQLGLQIAGEFRSGNGKAPGDGFTGGRFGYPGFEYGGVTYFLAGVSNDVLQVGMALASGKIIAGAGDVTIDEFGVVFENQEGELAFKDTNGARTMVLYSDADNFLVLANQFGAKGISFLIDDASHVVAQIDFTSEKINFKNGVILRAGADGLETVFNEDSFDVDFRIESAANANFFKIDAGAETLAIGGATTIDGSVEINPSNADQDFIIHGDTQDYVFMVNAGLNRVEFGTTAETVHIIDPTGTTYFNEPGNDVDFIIRDAGSNDIFKTDAFDGTITVTGDLNVEGNINLNSTALEATVAESNAETIFTVTSPGGTSAFAGTIATLPGGATLTYNVTSGTEGAMVPTATTQLAKMRLYNTTRGTSALISNCVTGTNTLTLTANVPAGWQVGDTITIASQTVSGGGFGWVDLEVTSGPINKSALFVATAMTSGTVGDALRLHPLDTFGSGKIGARALALVAGQPTDGFGLIPMSNNVFSLSWTGTPTTVTIREAGYLSL